MPIKKDDKGNRWVEMETLVPGTPDEVWRAMATGAGNTAWFADTEIEERVGGDLRFSFGSDMSTTGEVTIWEPPHRFGYVETTWAPGAPPIATEITITGRAGGKCVVRMVHSLFSSSDDWDDQMEGFEGGWQGFFAVLQIYLKHFAGRRGASVRVMTSVAGEPSALWSHMMGKLDLLGANVGEQRAMPEALQSLSGTVELVHQDGVQRYMLLRLEPPFPGIALIGTYASGAAVMLSAMLFFYGDAAPELARESEPKWRTWFEQEFSAYEKAVHACMPDLPADAKS